MKKLFLYLVNRAVVMFREVLFYFKPAGALDYAKMQKKYYERAAKNSKVVSGSLKEDHVVGTWREHDGWMDYEVFLMKYVSPPEKWIALDFGCGPGRNIRRWSEFFGRIDGADISKNNLANARNFLKDEIDVAKFPNLYLTSGSDCGDAPSNAYDFVFSTICLQHICSHSIRLSIIRDIFRILRPGGRVSIQMGFGSPSPMTVRYFDDNFAAITTNRGCDTEVSSPEEPRGDLESVGFREFEYWIRPVGPGDIHPNWIFFTAVKPLLSNY